jgi:type II secretory pathway pseudopilin PulG
LLEILVALGILLSVTAIVMSVLLQMTLTQGTVSNRTEMHSSVRSATEVLQQEIGQAGRVALPASVTLSAAVTATGVSTTVGVSSSTGMFNNELLVIDTGANQETVTVTSVGTNQITAVFNNTHALGAPVTVAGVFSSGIVPPSMANGSTSTVLKMYGDINGDGNMVYVEYTCDTAAGNLYRNVMPYNADPATKSANKQVLLPNIQLNPGGTPCFSYQVKTVIPNDYVVDVAVTLTVQTQNPDPTTNQFQQETKALLNVSPRNVFEGWQLASALVTNRIQPMPPSVTNLLP